jgi:hypothetical protein
MNKLEKQQKVVLLQDGILFYMDAERADALADAIRPLNFDDQIKFDGRDFTKRMYLGVFLPGDIEEQTKRKNGDWICRIKKWHHRGEQCDCTTMESLNEIKRREEAVAACGKCSNGYIMVSDDNDVSIARECECVALIHS